MGATREDMMTSMPTAFTLWNRQNRSKMKCTSAKYALQRAKFKISIVAISCTPWKNETLRGKKNQPNFCGSLISLEGP